MKRSSSSQNLAIWIVFRRPSCCSYTLISVVVEPWQCSSANGTKAHPFPLRLLRQLVSAWRRQSVADALCADMSISPLSRLVCPSRITVPTNCRCNRSVLAHDVDSHLGSLLLPRTDADEPLAPYRSGRECTEGDCCDIPLDLPRSELRSGFAWTTTSAWARLCTTWDRS